MALLSDQQAGMKSGEDGYPKKAIDGTTLIAGGDKNEFKAEMIEVFGLNK